MHQPIKTIILAGLAILLWAGNAIAFGNYYIEVGSELEEEEAMAQWRMLSKKYPNTLGVLEFYPTTVVHQDTNRVTTRIQAGPLETKLDAYKICGDLFDANLPCFVVEGMDHIASERPEKEHAFDDSGPAEPLPWLVNSKQQLAKRLPEPIAAVPPPASTADDVEEETLLGWVFSGFESEDGEGSIESRDLQPARQGEVQVAEAIRVPLSGAAVAAPRVEFTEERNISAQAVAQASAASDAMPHEGGWLMVQSFNSESRASDFWRAVRVRDPIQTAGFNVRVIKPVSQLGREPAVRLHIGPFTGLREADYFCKTIIQTKNDTLECRFLSEAEVAEMGDDTLTRGHTHGERYNERERKWKSGRGGDSYSLSQPPASKRVYWLHVATAQSQMEALQTWDAMRKKHADLLDGLRSSVSSTLSKKTRYILRVGPLESASAASELCRLLHQRQLFCRVYSNM
ncbi:MAG: SPOR domain-containing protein [Alphaproteobacteria bacterium]